jgi:outer membrane protein
MLRKLPLVLSILALVGVIVIGAVVFTTSIKMVYVDSTKLISEYKGMQDARKNYQQKASVWKANVDTLALEVQQQIMSYEKDHSRLSAKEQKLTEELLRTKQKQLMDFQQAMNAQAQQEDQKMTGEVVRQINSYIKKYGQSHGYNIVMAATQYGNIAYADEGLDITEEVLDGLNKEYSGK